MSSCYSHGMKRISAIDRERDLILTTLNQYGGSRVQVCKTLGIHRGLLLKKLDQYAAQGFTVPPPAKGWIVRDAARVARKKAAQERP
jgi:Bacterial regulatory protein, Fis family